MRRRIPWWITPFLGSIVAIVGAFVLTWIAMRPFGEAFAEALGKGFGKAVHRFWVPAGRPPDLDIAPGAPGYVETLGMAGRQMHFHDKDSGVTTIAVEVWVGGGKMRVPVAEYDGPPSPSLARDRARPLEPLLAMLVVRAADGAEVWWTGGGAETPRGPNRAGADGLNLLVFPGRLNLWTGDGPRHEVEVAAGETVWCTLGPDGLVIDRRQAAPATPR